ncbi:ATP-binding protein [Vulcanisaeta sp. JCM 16161]|uniref:AAA family ATPase n=1 Tax=Vulcanisaeta sp. JCM 16161 TaxID=1295372 RepID=UPI000ADC10AF|nr:ATP-binding protein [Vulcanisaeta sp. JCM 16161]
MFRGDRLIAVYGIRRIGKTSLVKAFLSDLSQPYVLIDVRQIYFVEGNVNVGSLVRHVLDGFREFMGRNERFWEGFRDALRSIDWVRVGAGGVEVRLSRRSRMNLMELLNVIDGWCGRNSTRFILVFDEAQYMRFSNVRYDGVLAWAYDNLSNVTFIVTGSEVGALRDFLRIDDPEAPLYGRYIKEVYVDRFSKDASLDFLRRGFTELGVEVSEGELEEVYERLDGIVGWLTLYGYLRGIDKLGHREALDKVFNDGVKLVLSELDAVIKPSRARYLAILNAVAHGLNTWSEIRRYVEVRTGEVSDAVFNRLMKNLIRYGYLSKVNNTYVIPDPVVTRAVMEVHIG